MTTLNLWDAAKAVLRGKFIPIQSYLKTPKTTGKSRTNKQTNKNKISRRKESIKIWAEIKEKEMKETIVKINKWKAGSLRR